MKTRAVDPLYLIDAIGPFFRGDARRVINWSKIPWPTLPVEPGPETEAWWTRVREDLDKLAGRAAAWGFNAVSMDDVAHLALHPWIERDVREKMEVWRRELRECIAVVRRHGLGVHLTLDVLCASLGVRERMRRERRGVGDYLAELLDRFFIDFAEVSGVILRIGESDGKDVHDVVHSELAIRTASEANALLRKLLPVFEKHQRRLVFRTWTVGAYPVGDLIWHRETFARVFRGIESAALVISMKYGESDFFRHLPLNANFFRTRLPTIVELQTRREYEGCGEYPSFVGWEYERYAEELRRAPNCIGCMVWCQTGGWVPFRRLAFLDEEALWTDLNTFVTLRIVQDRKPVEEAVRAFARECGIHDAEAMIELLRLSDEVINELLYIKEFATQKLFFRRVRIPPLLQVYWHNLFINHSVKKLVAHFVPEGEAALRSAARCLDRLERMKTLAGRAGLPVADIEFMADTFQLLALAREYCFLPFDAAMEARIRAAKRAYKKKYPKSGARSRYRIKTDFTPLKIQRKHLGWAVQFLMRRQRGYRVLDRLFTLHLLARLYRIVAHRRPHWIPGFARESAMGVDVVFR